MTAPTGRKPGRPKGQASQPASTTSSSIIPPTPRELSIKGKKEWTRIWETGTWLHRQQHYMLVLNYCQKVEEIAEFQKELKHMRTLGTTPGVSLSVYQQANGAWAPFPQVRLIAEGRAHLLAMLAEMKLSPSHLPESSDEEEAYMKEIRKRDRSGRVAAL